MEIKPDEFAVPFFLENGFTRKRCPKCQSHYWTQDPDSPNCRDAPCQEYTFIGNPPTRGSFTLAEMREKFLSFFEDKGHTRIKPYPVIARWRDDVYLVGASIYDFQPDVTEGILPPPANPLVVSQPCLRFTDIDNVGPTGGRHLTIFEMGGAHAFNYPDKKVYWKDETIRFHHDLLTNGLGIKSEAVTYKEHFWSGGGNAGPDVEACVDGLEVSTLVFMQFKVQDSKFIELPIKTVDTGYGIERWSWISQGSVTGFHAIYKPILEEIEKLSGHRIDERIAAEATRISSTMSVQTEEAKAEFRRRLAERMGQPLSEVAERLRLMEATHAIADHVKSMSFMLAEGVVPSNAREGYLARLLVRRVLRMLRLLGIEDRLLDVVEDEIRYWSATFPNLKAMGDEILEALKVEEEKYLRTLKRGGELVERVALEVKSKGSKSFPPEKLVEFYDSHGLVPEIVKELCAEKAVDVPIPPDFYSLVAQRHLAARANERQDLHKDLKDQVATFPRTKELFYEDSNMKSFEAQVLGSVNGRYAILDRTCFYPEGGGQPADHGQLRYDGGTLKVIDVIRVGNVILHQAEGKIPGKGTAVRGEIDWQRRISLTRHHTATHIMVGAVRRVLGEHAWQTGAQKDIEKSRLDISHYLPLTREQVRKLEELVCEVITQDIPVEKTWLPREKAEQQYGYRLYQGGVVPGREIRVVKIGDWDVEACGGTHVDHTGQVGLLKILHAERIQDGVERLIYAAGAHALRSIQAEEESLLRTAEVLNASPEKVAATAKEMVERLQVLQKQVEQFRGELASIEAKELLGKSKKIGGMRLITARKASEDEDYLIQLGNKLIAEDPACVAVLLSTKATGKVVVFAGDDAVRQGANAGKIAGELAKEMGGGGGGKPNFGQGGGPRKEAGAVLELAEEIVSKIGKRK